MVVISVDIFSGRPNPKWILDRKDAKGIMKMIASKPEIISRVDRNQAGYEGLGYRGIYVGMLSDDLTFEYDLPHHFMILNGAASQDSKDQEIGLQLIDAMTKGTFYHERKEEKEFYDNTSTKLIPFIKEEMLKTLKRGAIKTDYQIKVQDGGDTVPIEKKQATLKSTCCYIELCAFNPGFWNNCKTIKQNNNCYNYGTNRRTDTRAQPGTGSGHPNYTMQCANVSQAARYDGAHNRYDCFPDSEAPRYLMAMVVWPDVDYHWYRKHCEGFWGHKPGSTNAKNTDNNGNIIYNPETCARGGYTQFCGYFYSCKSMKVS
jgi:hypothetical protein